VWSQREHQGTLENIDNIERNDFGRKKPNRYDIKHVLIYNIRQYKRQIKATIVLTPRDTTHLPTEEALYIVPRLC
jgi:hypothetical protein